MSDATGTGDATGGKGVAINETERLIASDKVEGTAVYNRQDEAIGSVYTLMIDKFSGQVAYAVMSFGGFLGIGERYHVLPWKALDFDPRWAATWRTFRASSWSARPPTPATRRRGTTRPTGGASTTTTG
jgi:hypothetical protein